MTYWLWQHRYAIMVWIGLACVGVGIAGIWGLDERAMLTAAVIGFLDFMAITYPLWDDLEPQKPQAKLSRETRKKLKAAEQQILFDARIMEMEKEAGIPPIER